MKIGIIQALPITGDIAANIAAHKKLINEAFIHGADTLIFPELSLTGYEPTLAQNLAMEVHDSRLDDFQLLSDTQDLTIGVGVPLRTARGITISMIIFQPDQPRQVYSKRYLHPDEEAYFVGGEDPLRALGEGTLALAICYELSVPEHAESATKSGAKIYIASVAKSARGIQKAEEMLSAIAKNHNMTVFMANCVGPCDGEVGGGKSAIWNREGELVGQMNGTEEGILIFDTNTELVKIISVQPAINEPEKSS